MSQTLDAEREQQIKEALRVEWRLKTEQGIHHDHLSDLAFLIAAMEHERSVSARLRAAHVPAQLDVEEAAKEWLRTTTLAKGSSGLEDDCTSYLERALQRIIGACSDPLPMLTQFINWMNRFGSVPTPQGEQELLRAIDALIIDANRLCDRQLGGSYEADCRRSLEAAKTARRAYLSASAPLPAPTAGQGQAMTEPGRPLEALMIRLRAGRKMTAARPAVEPREEPR